MNYSYVYRLIVLSYSLIMLTLFMINPEHLINPSPNLISRLSLLINASTKGHSPMDIIYYCIKDKVVISTPLSTYNYLIFLYFYKALSFRKDLKSYLWIIAR